MLFEKDLLSVRLLTMQDYPLLVKWLSQPQVLEFYEGRDQSYNMAKISRLYGSKNLRGITACIVEYRGENIGYVQFYALPDQQKNEYGLRKEELIYGIDLFIGETSFWNRGIGTLLVTSLVQYLEWDCKVHRIVADPFEWNVRAIRCYEKAGFRKWKYLQHHEIHEGTWQNSWLMMYSSAK